jgi:hypothetical protein
MSTNISIKLNKGFIAVENYDALPSVVTNINGHYWVIASQGIAWLPYSVGGTYHPKGIYFSDGFTWTHIDTPFQATQGEVNIGLNDDKFLTPSTFNESALIKSKVNIATNQIFLIDQAAILIKNQRIFVDFLTKIQ